MSYGYQSPAPAVATEMELSVMWKKIFLTLAIISAPAIMGCAASGGASGSVSEDGASGSASGSATGGDDDASSTSKSTTR